MKYYFLIVRAFTIVIFLLYQVTLATFYSSQPTYKNDTLTEEKNLMNEAHLLAEKFQSNIHIWKKILQLNPRNTQGNIHLGLYLMGNKGTSEEAFQHVEKALNPALVDDPVKPNSPQYFLLAHMVGRYRMQENEFSSALKYIQMARYANPEECVCTDLMLASIIDTYPISIEAADDSMQRYHDGMNAILDRASKSSEGVLHLKTNWISTIPGAQDDYYVYCLSSLFAHSFYYRAKVALGASKHFQVARAVWPELIYVRPNLITGTEVNTESSVKLSNLTHNKKCVKRKIRLGVASGHFSQEYSVTADFQGMLKHLCRDIFDITFIYIQELKVDPADVMLDTRDNFLIIKKTMNDGTGMHRWLEKPRKDIEALDLDVLLYLDLTMSSYAHRLAMSRLAHIQAVSHGHPITSGFPRSIMNYYISWAGAELPFKQAQSHYTEELKLLPNKFLHQYYDHRVSNDGRSNINQMPFREIVSTGRSSFSRVNPNGHWYLNMQKPFKLHPEYDYMLCGIVNADPLARLILHEEIKESNKKIFMTRLQSAGCDMKRVYFIPALPHHTLLALYLLSDVILDSYPAGGCTTTREALELGKVVVTLPARYLGSRWSLGYYHILGDDILNKIVVASDMDDYILKASSLGMNKNLRKSAEERVKINVNKLFHSMEAVKQWTQLLLDISPVEINNDSGYCLNKHTNISLVEL